MKPNEVAQIAEAAAKAVEAKLTGAFHNSSAWFVHLDQRLTALASQVAAGDRPVERPAPKLCKDCKHAIPERNVKVSLWGLRDAGPNWDSPPRCSRAGEMSLVTGKRKLEYCNVERGDYGKSTTCGPGAKYFEPR